MAGYFKMGIFQPQHGENVGTLWRSAYQLGALGIFTVGRRYDKQASDTHSTYRHIPLEFYETFDILAGVVPVNAKLVLVEMDGIPLARFQHPEHAVYLLGSEAFGLDPIPQEVRQKYMTVSVESVRHDSYNVAVAGSLVMYDRAVKRGFEP